MSLDLLVDSALQETVSDALSVSNDDDRVCVSAFVEYLRACRRTPIMKQRTVRKSPLSQCGTPGCVMNAHHFGSCRWSDSYLRIMMDEVSINNRNEDDEKEKMHKEHEEEDKMRSSSNEN